MTPYDQALWKSGKETLPSNGKKPQKQAQGGAGERKSNEEKNKYKETKHKTKGGTGQI